MIIPFILVTLNAKSKAAVSPFETISISPLYNRGNSTVVVTTRSSRFNFSMFIKNDIYDAKEILSASITKPGTYTYKYDNAYTRNKNKVFLRYYTTSSESTVETEHIDRNLAKSSYGYIENNQSITTQSEIAIIRSDGVVNFRNLTYSFIGFDGLYVPSYYHKIDLSEFEILLGKNELPFFSCSPSLVIKNYNNIFDDIEGANETVTFDLVTTSGSLGRTFKLKNTLYVDKETLRLSSTPKDGYVKTEHIYFPINDMQNQSKYECYFAFKDFGIDKSLIIHSFELRALRNTFGDCRNSKYCVVRNSLWLTAFFTLYFLLYF